MKWVILLIGLCYQGLHAQTLQDLEECIVKITEIEEIESVLFSFLYNEDSALVIRKYHLINSLHNDSIDVTKISFEKPTRPIYVKNDAFIFMYIDYFLSFQEIVFSKDKAIFRFETMTWEPNTDYTFVEGKVKLEKQNGLWKVSKQKFSFHKDK